MDLNTRYKVKAETAESFKEALRLLEQSAKVQLQNPRRNTIAVTELDEATVETLRKLPVTIEEDVPYDLE